MSEAASPRERLAGQLVQLRSRVDAHFEAAVARSPEAFTCRSGCDSCCHQRFSVFEVEATPIRQALVELETRDPALRAQVRAQGHDADLPHCALLIDGRCSVYDQRPLICRSHGLPIAVAGDGPALEIDHCPLNFTKTPPPRASVLVLAAVNRPLAVLAELWQRGDETPGSAPASPRVELAALAAEATSKSA